jgi:hypothetical protein
MALGFSTALANAILDSLGNEGAAVDFFDNSLLQVRTGAKPADADTAPSGTLLAEITLPANAMAAASARAIVKAGTWQDASANATGTAGHFRIIISGDAGTTNTTDKRLDGTITATGGGGDMEVDNTSFASGQSFTVTTFTLNLPG